MKSIIFLLAILVYGAHLCAQESTTLNVMQKLHAHPDLLAAWNALNDASLTSPPEIRKNVSKLMTSQDDEIRLLVLLKKTSEAIRLLEVGSSPKLSDAMFLAQAILASSLSNQPTPGGEEQSGQRGAVIKLGQMLRTSLSVKDTEANSVQWEGETQADLVRWLQALTNALLIDKGTSDAQRDAARKLQTHLLDSTPPIESTPPDQVPEHREERLSPTSRPPLVQTTSAPSSTTLDQRPKSASSPTLSAATKPSPDFPTVPVAIVAAVIVGIVLFILRRKST
jgi:hypothetical protein